MSAVKCVRADFNGIDGMDMCRSSLAGAKINSLYSIHVTRQPTNHMGIKLCLFLMQIEDYGAVWLLSLPIVNTLSVYEV